MTEPPSGPAAQRYYDPALFRPLLAVEDRHFWFRSRNRAIATLVKQITANLDSGYRVLEVGCGTGNVLRILEETCPQGLVIGMDLFAEGLQHARRRTSCPLVQADINALPFGMPFDLIGLLDVLEHLPDDKQILRLLHRLLTPRGALLLTVPAHPSLWSYFDEASHHYRRYKLAELESKLIDSGYRVEYLTQFMASIFPLVWLGRRLADLTSRPSARTAARVHELATREFRVIPVVNGLLRWLLAAELPLIARRCRLPLGTLLLAVARRQS